MKKMTMKETVALVKYLQDMNLIGKKDIFTPKILTKKYKDSLQDIVFDNMVNNAMKRRR